MKFRTRRRGFTLVELLAATAIMSVIILAVVALSSSVLNVWSSSIGQLTANAEARGTIEQLSLDIEAAEARTRGRVWLQVTHEPIGPAGDERRMPTVYLITHTEDRPRFEDTNKNGTIDDGEEIPSDICAVVYKPAYRNPFTGNQEINQPPPPVFGLYRTALDGKNTFNGPLAMDRLTENPNHTLANYFEGSVTVPPVNNEQPGFVDFSGDPGELNELEDWLTNINNFTSSNVVDFQVRFWREYTDTGGNTILQPLVGSNGNLQGGAPPFDPSEPGISFLYADKLYRTSDAGDVNVANDAIDPSGRIVFADIIVTIISEEGMAAYANGLNPDYDGFDDYVREYGSTFSRRVYLMANYGQVLASN